MRIISILAFVSLTAICLVQAIMLRKLSRSSSSVAIEHKHASPRLFASEEAVMPITNTSVLPTEDASESLSTTAAAQIRNRVNFLTYSRHEPLLYILGSSAHEADQLTELLGARDQIMSDAQTSAIALTGRALSSSDLETLSAEQGSEIDHQISLLIGPTRYKIYADYQRDPAKYHLATQTATLIAGVNNTEDRRVLTAALLDLGNPFQDSKQDQLARPNTYLITSALLSNLQRQVSPETIERLQRFTNDLK